MRGGGTDFAYQKGQPLQSIVSLDESNAHRPKKKQRRPKLNQIDEP
jgi:hypothetical protein